MLYTLDPRDVDENTKLLPRLPEPKYKQVIVQFFIDGERYRFESKLISYTEDIPVSEYENILCADCPGLRKLLDDNPSVKLKPEMTSNILIKLPDGSYCGQ